MTTEPQQAACNTRDQNQTEQVYDLIKEFGGLINDEIATLTGIRQGAIAGLITELRWAGRVKDSGEKRRGEVHDQAVWVLGDDRDVVYRHRLKKLRKLADQMGYALVKTRGNDNA